VWTKTHFGGSPQKCVFAHTKNSFALPQIMDGYVPALTSTPAVAQTFTLNNYTEGKRVAILFGLTETRGPEKEQQKGAIVGNCSAPVPLSCGRGAGLAKGRKGVAKHFWSKFKRTMPGFTVRNQCFCHSF